MIPLKTKVFCKTIVFLQYFASREDLNYVIFGRKNILNIRLLYADNFQIRAFLYPFLKFRAPKIIEHFSSFFLRSKALIQDGLKFRANFRPLI